MRRTQSTDCGIDGTHSVALASSVTQGSSPHIMAIRVGPGLRGLIVPVVKRSEGSPEADGGNSAGLEIDLEQAKRADWVSTHGALKVSLFG